MHLPERLPVWVTCLAVVLAIVSIGAAFAGSGASVQALAQGDGLSDVFLYRSAANSGQVEVANGNLTWTADTPVIGFSTDWQIYPGYFNSDSLEDLFFYNYTSGIAVVLFSKGDGTWQQGTVDYVFGAGWAITIGYFNDDNISDIFALKYGVGFQGNNGGVVVYSDGDGNLTSGPLDGDSFGGNAYAHGLAGHFNSDSLTDLYTTNPGGGVTTTVYANGNGTWTDDTGAQPPAPGNLSYQVGKFNDDGLDDLFWSYKNGGTASTGEYFKNTGQGWSVPSGGCSNVDKDATFFLGDFDGDGRTDIFDYSDNGSTATGLTSISDGSGCWASSVSNLVLDPGLKFAVGKFNGRSEGRLASL
jgi:hypothetical protein